MFPLQIDPTKGRELHDFLVEIRCLNGWLSPRKPSAAIPQLQFESPSRAMSQGW